MAEDTDREDHTEDPTQHKLEEAARRGDVPKSQELPIFLSLGALYLGMMIAGRLGTGSTLTLDLRGFLMNAHLVADGPGGILVAGRHGLVAGLQALALPVGLVLAAVIAGCIVQHAPVWTAEPLQPKLNRLSPMAGVTRIFGKPALVQFVKGLVKVGIVGALASFTLWAERDRLEAMVGLEAGPLVALLAAMTLKLLGAVLALHFIVTAADVVYSRFSWMKRQRMTKEEVKREHKEQDGNPEMKAKLRQIRTQRSKKRQMAAVPTATVVVANPTHFAVALRYEAGMQAPICVAKGIDAIALRIRSIAEENGVPVVENPPLARALHATSELDQEIPVEHYKAVAEVIGFVLRLKRRAS